MATTRRRVPADRRSGPADRPEIHDGGDGRLQPRVPVSQGDVRKGRARQDPVSRGSHQQDMDGWPDYWPGLSPMHYATHCVSPCLALIDEPRRSTSRASARAAIREELIGKYGSRFAVETATSRSRTPTWLRTIWRSLFDTARQYRESFDVYGSKKSFEWHAGRGRGARDPHGQAAGAGDSAARSRCPITPICCPSRSAGSRRGDPGRRASFVHSGGGHGGSHPHLVHEFLGARGRSRSLAQRGAIGQLDLRRHLCASVGIVWRPDRRPARVHLGVVPGRAAETAHFPARKLSKELPV